MICLSKSDTYPVEIKNAVHVYRTTTDYLNHGDSNFIPNQLIDIVQEILCSYTIQCFHATRIIDKNLIWNNGLGINNWEVYSTYMKNTLLALNIKNEIIEECINYLKDMCQKKYGKMWYIYLFTLWDGTKSQNKYFEPNYFEYARNIGGEVALDIDNPNVKKILREKGTPILVECKVPFIDVIDLRKPKIARAFIDFFLSNQNRERMNIEFEILTNKVISPENIINIHDLTLMSTDEIVENFKNNI